MNVRFFPRRWTVQHIASQITIFLITTATTSAQTVNLTVVKNAGDGLCLDGSRPAYHFQPGTGRSSRKWLVSLEGGGWCSDRASCADRAKTNYGSSSLMEPIVFDGLLSSNPATNPDFYAWTRVKVRSCDGSSWASNATDPSNQIFFRGKEIWRTVMAELLKKGLRKADQVLLTGCSGGGHAAILHCDAFADLLPNAGKVRCMSDAGFLLRVPDVAGRNTISDLMSKAVELHNVEASLPPACTMSLTASECFFPENIVPYVRTPLFLVNSGYDVWQIGNVLLPAGSDPKGTWSRCRSNLANCSPEQVKVLQDFRAAMLRTVKPVHDSAGGGLYLHSCYVHCETEQSRSWSGTNGVLVQGKSIAQAVGDWFFDRSPAKLVDCPTPACNPSC